MTDGRLPARVLAVEACARLLAGAVPLFFFFPRATAEFLDGHSPTVGLLIASEALGLAFVLTARFSADTDRSLASSALAVFASFFFLVVELRGHVALLPVPVTATIQAVAIAFQLVAKISLGRSFGIVPANRGVVDRGAYRLVRHPVYLGHLVAQLGFLASAFSLRNVLALAILWTAQILRIRREEALLARDERYRAYQARVRWRLVPRIF